MTDEMILRLAAEASEALSKMEFWMTCHEFCDVYHRMLRSAQENHPGTELERIGPLKVPSFGQSLVGNVNYPAEMRIRFSELRIVLEAFQTESEKAKK
jgi:hypothetical protein